MSKYFLTLILILTALFAMGFLPGSDAVVHAIGVDETVQADPLPAAYEDSTAFSASPVMQVVVGLIAVLFGGLTFLPLLGKEDSRGGSAESGSLDEC